MSIFGNLILTEKAKITSQTSNTGYKLSNLSIDGIHVAVYSKDSEEPSEEVLSNLDKDILIMKKNYENHLKNDFIPWLKGDQNNIDDKTILKQLKLYEIVYSYSNYSDKYSPTGKSGKFGSFEFSFKAEKDSELSKTLLSQPAAMEIIIYNKTSKKERCYDI